MGINGILTVINVSSMIRPIQPYDLANATVLSGSFYAVENIVLRRGLFFSTAGKRFASPLGHSLVSAAARNGILVIPRACQPFTL